MLNRRQFVRRTAAVSMACDLVVSLLPGFAAAQDLSLERHEKKVDERPNIVFIMADDLGYGELGCYGCEDIKTPNIDKLAADGIRFTDFYANSPVCSPNRIAFLTGRYQQRSGIDNALIYQEKGRGIPLGKETIADTLKAAGYATGLF